MWVSWLDATKGPLTAGLKDVMLGDECWSGLLSVVRTVLSSADPSVEQLDLLAAKWAVMMVGLREKLMVDWWGLMAATSAE
jgi:hypothetical protein